MRDIRRKIKIVIKYLEMLEKGHEHKIVVCFIEIRPKNLEQHTQWLACDYGEILLIFQMIFQTFILVSASVEMKKQRRM